MITWPTVCSAPHSQTAEEAIPHSYKQQEKRPTPVRRRLSRTQALLGRVTSGGSGVGDANAESCGVVRSGDSRFWGATAGPKKKVVGPTSMVTFRCNED